MIGIAWRFDHSWPCVLLESTCLSNKKRGAADSPGDEQFPALLRARYGIPHNSGQRAAGSSEGDLPLYCSLNDPPFF